MLAESQTALIKELAENRAWLGRLARALVGDASADDLVQDAIEITLRHPPDADRSLRPWLRKVVSNLARMQWRSGERRRRREEMTEAAESVESIEISLGRLETHRRVVDAVIGLAEPYRQTIVFRYVHGMSAAEIARRLDVPSTTVRSRLLRGLDMLRADLDRASDRASWQLALAPTCAAQGASWSPILLGGIMKKVVLLLIGLSVAAVAIATRGGASAGGERARDTEEAAPVASPAPKPSAEAEAVAVVPTVPHRFRDAAERQRFAGALAEVRARIGERRPKTFDFSGSTVPSVPAEAPPRGPAPPLGELDKDYIRGRIREIVPLVRECYELALASDPALSGELAVEFVIDAEEEVGGYVREAAIASDSSLQDPILTECVTETILSVSFVAPEGGGEVRVRYPFLFAQD